jgi:hypothetical protein
MRVKRSLRAARIERKEIPGNRRRKRRKSGLPALTAVKRLHGSTSIKKFTRLAAKTERAGQLKSIRRRSIRAATLSLGLAA